VVDTRFQSNVRYHSPSFSSKGEGSEDDHPGVRSNEKHHRLGSGGGLDPCLAKDALRTGLQWRILPWKWDAGLKSEVLELVACRGGLQRPKMISVFGNDGIINNAYRAESD
jgi:hypothetical protein